MVTGWPGRMSRSSPSLKLAVTQMSSRGTMARRGWPGCTTWPTSTVFLLTTPPSGALIEVCSRSSRARSTAARACATWASAPAARERDIATCSDAVPAWVRLAWAPCTPASASRSWATAPSCSARGGGGTDRRVVLLPRHLVLGHQRFQALEVLRRLGGLGLRLPDPGLGHPDPRGGGGDVAVGRLHLARGGGGRPGDPRTRALRPREGRAQPGPPPRT